MTALQHFETAEANLVKLERLWNEIHALIPGNIQFTSGNSEYDDRCRAFDQVLAALPLIDSWKPDIVLPDLNGIAQNRFDAEEIGELSAKVAIETAIGLPGREIQDYRFRFNQKRRALIRDTLIDLIDQIDAILDPASEAAEVMDSDERIPDPVLENLRERVSQIDVLLGSAPRPVRWNDLLRHLAFGLICDLNDIEKLDWPQVKAGLRKNLYGENEPLPATVTDLGNLVAAKPRGGVVTKLAWSNLDGDGFERLIFNLISTADGYENPKWLTRTNAADRGRDLSVTRIVVDQLSGTRRTPVIIQCRHWQSQSIGLPEVALIREQMELWGEPRIEVVIIATSGRFTTDAVQRIEKHNASGDGPFIDMWPESHLERLLASRPALVAEFHLR